MSSEDSARQTPAAEPVHDPLRFPIVGVGASAGGLEAFSELLEYLPADPGLAILFVLHLQPDQASHLSEILARRTPLTVHQAADGMRVEVNRVYLIPPNKTMALRDGSLALSTRPPHGVHMPIDHLFRSMAHVQKSRAVGVIMSGEGTDGTLGFQTIKAEGGITFAQTETTSKHDAMPRSAVRDGCVDYVMPPAQIARELLRIARHPYAQQPHDEATSQLGEDRIGAVIAALRVATDVDFSHYKRSTIQRRIQRRMALRNVDSIDEYLRLLHEEPAEVTHLYQDFLIRVTQFFRDPDVFEMLKTLVFPALLLERSAAASPRFWVAGCSTGEEVYSLAIALLEFLGSRAETMAIKILATDLNEAALERARAGYYLDNIEIDVSPERLRRFFVRVDGNYQISKSVRDLCVFSRHNMAGDPPFSHLDLVSCRNVLIYMDGALQKRVLPILHYALNPDGFLLLGSSESIGTFGDLFTPVDMKHRIYRKKPAIGAPLDFGSYVNLEGMGRRTLREGQGPIWTALDVQREADRIMLARYAPVGVIIDDAMTVLQFRGRTVPFLEPAPGMASLDLLRMLREGLLSDVRTAINQAKADDNVVVRERVLLTEPGRSRHVKVEVVPFRVAASGARFFLVLFQETTAEAAPAATLAPVAQPAEAGAQAAQLQQELTALREYLQSVFEEQESTNEELKSANEEILSANEELQSTNEELQTAKEEAQSANEELATVNEELRHRNTEMTRINNDLINLLSGVNIPIVMVGRDLRIRRFTPLAEKLFNLIPSDTGRPISDIKPNLQMADLPRLISEVIDSLTPYEGEVQSQQGRWYALRIRPYVTLDNKIDGASIVLLDIDSMKRALDQLPTPGAEPESQDDG